MTTDQPAPEVPQPNPRIPGGAWRSVFDGHPRIFGPPEHLRALARAKPGGYEDIRSMRRIGAAGVVHAVEGLPAERIRPFIDKALRNVARGPTNIHQDTWLWLQQAAFALDFFHDQIAPADRAKIIDWINAHLESFTDDENAFHNSTLSKVLCYLRIAYATRGENPRADEFRQHAIARLYEGRVVPVLRAFGAGGGFTECGWYCRGSLLHLVEAMELARRVEGYDGFQQAPGFYYQRLAYEMLQPYPPRLANGCQRYACEGDGTVTYSGAMEYPRIMRTLIAQYFRGSELSRYTAAAGGGGGQRGRIRLMEFLYQEPPDEPLAAEGFPPAHLAAGVGKVFARGDWSEGATWLRFECGDYWNQHQHFEAGNFEIFRHQPLATESGEYVGWDSPHALNWLVRTIAHNCILVHRNAEAWRYCRNRKGLEMANDGGQANHTDIVDTLAEWTRRREDFRRGRIVAYDDRPEFLYVAGDATAAYDPAKASRILRQIVFLRPHTFVMLDRVVSTRAEYAKAWLLHCRNEPRIEAAGFSVANERGRLFVQTLLPAPAVIEKVQGYVYGGREFPPASSRRAKGASRWRVEVRPPAPATEDVFLHVLSTDGPAPAALLRQDDHIGARGDRWEVVFNPAGGGTVRIAGRWQPFAPAVHRGPYEQ